MTGYLRCFNSGGNYNNTTYGLASFNGNNARSNANNNIGFRADLSKRDRCGQQFGDSRVSFQYRR